VIELKYTSRQEVFGGINMNSNDSVQIENIIFKYIDEFKVLFFPDQWSDIFLNYSRSELLALLYLYRFNEANMTQIAEYIVAPLNTTTGVIGRLEKSKLVERVRSSEDRRIVFIKLTDKAKEILEKEKSIITNYISKIYGSLTKEERDTAFTIITKVIGIIRQEETPGTSEDKGPQRIKKITIE
jgi:MarR family transcriptional regulator, organic hydroperoxide resistance regulator